MLRVMFILALSFLLPMSSMADETAQPGIGPNEGMTKEEIEASIQAIREKSGGLSGPRMESVRQAQTESLPALPPQKLTARLPASAPAELPAKPSQVPDEIQRFKEVVDDGDKQIIRPDKRQFASLARNYVNRFTCRGQIEKMIVPQDQGLEAEITNDNHDLFLRVGQNPNKQFPVDISLICDGHVFLINAVVHPHVPSQEIVLQLPTGVRPLSASKREKYGESIKAAEALPLEERISRIMQRVYKGDLLPYWREVETPTSQSLWNYSHYSVLLQRVVKTEIDNLVAWDFVFRGRLPVATFYDAVRKVVEGEVVAFGRVGYDTRDAARVIVITREREGE